MVKSSRAVAEYIAAAFGGRGAHREPFVAAEPRPSPLGPLKYLPVLLTLQKASCSSFVPHQLVPLQNFSVFHTDEQFAGKLTHYFQTKRIVSTLIYAPSSRYPHKHQAVRLIIG